MDWLEKISCIKCDNGGSLLVCSENGCPIAVHEGCLGCPAKFDDSGRFYCPYCLYRQAVSELRKATEYVSARKNALMVFMDEKVMRGKKPTREDNTHHENGNNQSKSSEANVGVTGDDGKSKTDSNGITDQLVRLYGEENIKDSAGSEGGDPSLEILGEKGDGNDVRLDGEENIKDNAGSKGKDSSLEMPGEKSDRTEEDKNVQEEEHETSAQEHVQEKGLLASERKQTEEEDHESSAEEQIQEEHETPVEEEKSEEENQGTSSASTDDDVPLIKRARAMRAKRSKQVAADSDADQEPSKRLKKHGKKKQTSVNVTPTRRSSRQSSTPKKTEKVSNKEVGSPKRLRKSEPSVKVVSDAFGSPKRKRLMWTEAEEDALWAGVDKYAKESKNLPWRKILEMGKEHFDSSRTPADLKDKWRNMTGK